MFYICKFFVAISKRVNLNRFTWNVSSLNFPVWAITRCLMSRPFSVMQVLKSEFSTVSVTVTLISKHKIGEILLFKMLAQKLSCSIFCATAAGFFYRHILHSTRQTRLVYNLFQDLWNKFWCKNDIAQTISFGLRPNLKDFFWGLFRA